MASLEGSRKESFTTAVPGPGSKLDALNAFNLNGFELKHRPTTTFVVIPGFLHNRWLALLSILIIWFVVVLAWKVSLHFTCPFVSRTIRI